MVSSRDHRQHGVVVAVDSAVLAFHLFVERRGERDEPMFATASQVRRWLLVEVHGSWGPHAVTDSELGHYAPPVWRRAMAAAGIRVVAIRRNLDDKAPASMTGVRLVHVRTARPGEVVGSTHRIVVDDLRHVVLATECLLNAGRTR